MKISVDWLKDYVSVGIPIEKLAHKLTMAGLEVEKIDSIDGDSVLELEITPNRPDCLNILGISREVSAILNRTLKLPKVRKIRYPGSSCNVEILDRAGCPRYIGTVIADVQINKSPDKIQKRLKSIGLKSINNVVDITNFCLMETGQPLHAFDYDKLVGRKIVVRRARKGEKIVTLDGEERTLDSSILVIADTKRPVAIAGIMGGQETEVTAKTKNILLESAYFDPILVRRASRLLGIATDSSYRFERGVDIHMVENGAARAISLIKETAGGTLEQRKDLFPAKRKVFSPKVTISVAQINSLLGDSLTSARCKTILKKLDFKVSVENRQVLKVQPPSCRGDIKSSVDVVEEVARIVGYDNLPLSLPTIKVSSVPVNSRRHLKNSIREALMGQGFNEAITYTLVNAEASEDILQVTGGCRVKNPLTQEQGLMRMSLLPGLLSALRLNLNRGQRDIRLFEIGKKYFPSEETEVVGLVATGLRNSDWRMLDKEPVDFYDIKGAVEAVLKRLNYRNEVTFEKCDYPPFDKGEQAQFSLGEKSYGVVGKISKDTSRKLGIKHDNIYFAEFDLNSLHEGQKVAQAYQSPPEYPSIVRDVSLAVKDTVNFQQIVEIARKIGSKLLVDVHFVEQYLGDKIPEGHRGLVFSFVYQSSIKTLTEDEVNGLHDKICENFVSQLEAIIR